MKTIVILLAIIASTNTEKIRTSLRLDGGQSDKRGVVYFEQDALDAPIKITGNITNLDLGKYFAFVLEEKNDTNNNNCSGSIGKKESGVLFLVFIAELKAREHLEFSLPSVKFTLIPHALDSISGRAIALYDPRKMKLDSRRTEKRDDIIACGIVEETEVVPETSGDHTDREIRISSYPSSSPE